MNKVIKTVLVATATLYIGSAIIEKRKINREVTERAKGLPYSRNNLSIKSEINTDIKYLYALRDYYRQQAYPNISMLDSEDYTYNYYGISDNDDVVKQGIKSLRLKIFVSNHLRQLLSADTDLFVTVCLALSLHKYGEAAKLLEKAVESETKQMTE